MPSSFPQLCQDVMTKTGRPELVAETQLAVRNATKFLHLSDFYLRDCDELLLQFVTPDFVFQIDIPSKLERFRKLSYIKKFDLTTNLTREGEDHKLVECGPTALFDAYNSVKKNIFYIAGSNLNVRSSTQESALLVSWYKYPVTDPDSYTSWIADMYDPAIVDKATAEVFRAIGMKDDANAQDNIVNQIHLPIIRMNDIEATAR